MTKELTPGQALDALIDGDTVVDSELRSEWTWPHCSGYELGEFCSFGPFTIKPKTSKLTAEMVVKACHAVNSALCYRVSIGVSHYLTTDSHRGFCLYGKRPLEKEDFDADDWVMEE